MKRQIGLLAFAVFFTSSLSNAQNNCPEGFHYVGTLSGSGSFGDDFDKKVYIRFPKNAKIDTTYQQTTVRATNGQSNARSTLRPQDIPKGIHIVPYGSSNYDKGWAVSDPELKGIEWFEGRVTRNRFGMKLFCTMGIGEYKRNFGGCDVQTDVCYKPKQ